MYMKKIHMVSVRPRRQRSKPRGPPLTEISYTLPEISREIRETENGRVYYVAHAPRIPYCWLTFEPWATLLHGRMRLAGNLEIFRLFRRFLF